MVKVPVVVLCGEGACCAACSPVVETSVKLSGVWHHGGMSASTAGFQHLCLLLTLGTYPEGEFEVVLKGIR